MGGKPEKPKDEKAYFSKVVLPLIFGGLVTLAVNLSISFYSDKQREEQQRTDYTLAFNKEILSSMNGLRVAAKASLDAQDRVFQLLPAEDGTELSPVQDEMLSLAFDEFFKKSDEYLSLFDKWENERLIYRSNTKIVFGEKAANALDDRSERRLSATLNECVIVADELNSAKSDKELNCADQQFAHAAKLDEAIDAAIDGDFAAYEQLSATSFSARARIVKLALQRYSVCGKSALGKIYPETLQPSEAKLPPFCKNYVAMTSLMRSYIGTLSLARERFADRLAEG